MTETLVQVRGLIAGYPAGPPVLRDVSFRVGAGERVGLLGPNGGGKTTLFRVLLGELRPLDGEAAVGARAASVPQTERSRLDFPVSALDVALMGTLPVLPWWRRPGRAQRRRALEALETVGLLEQAHETFGELSGGQRQRALIARALVQDAQLLLLDEPFSGLDAPSAERLMALLDALAAEGRGLMIATHDVEQARAWDLVLCLNRRQVAFGAPDEVLTREALEATYGGEIVEIPAGDGSTHGVLPAHHHHHDHG
jgi:ABC-type Mn2+/Zn2+ transport system ATPase subunit